MEFLFLKS